MSILNKLLRLYVKNAKTDISTKPLLSEKHPGYSLDNLNRPTYQFPSSNAPAVDTSTKNSFQKKFNPSTDSYCGLHEYE